MTRGMIGTLRRRGVVTAFALLLSCAGVTAQTATEAKEHLRLVLDPSNPSNLPILLALDRGYFAEQHIDLEISKLTGSSATLMPLLARGDLQIAPIPVSGAFFNQFASGFDIKLIASAMTTHPGWQDMSWILVRQDIWDAGGIRQPADLKGHRIELGPDGSPLMALMLGVLRMGGLSLKDVSSVQHVRSQGDMLASLRNNAVDVIGVPEPAASQLQKDGLGHKFLSVQDVNPGTQELFIAASGKVITEHRDLVRHFLVAYLKGEQDVLAAGPKWTPAMLAIMVKWSGYTEAQVAAFDGPTYPGALGTINVGLIEAQQQLWLSLGKIAKPVEVKNVIDDSVLGEARHELGVPQ
jgi:NitT/TauT family transport system substrate-binding protein